MDQQSTEIQQARNRRMLAGAWRRAESKRRPNTVAFATVNHDSTCANCAATSPCAHVRIDVLITNQSSVGYVLMTPNLSIEENETTTPGTSPVFLFFVSPLQGRIFNFNYIKKKNLIQFHFIFYSVYDNWDLSSDWQIQERLHVYFCNGFVNGSMIHSFFHST